MQRIKKYPYFLNTAIMLSMILVLLILLHIFPFGKNTLLTIDLGQQYIDFFSLFRETFLHAPEMLIYSFQKGIGGEMLGLWSYYLLSPLNLILLLFNDQNLDLAVTLLTIIKLCLASLSMHYFIQKRYPIDLFGTLSFSLSYAWMSYMLVYLLNIMWLDALILLPLIALGLYYLLSEHKPYLYVFSLALLLFSNYYVGYMVSLFLSIYAFYTIFEIKQPSSIKQTIKSYATFLKYSILAVMLAGVSLIPTFWSLLSSKAADQKFEINLEVAYSLPEMLSKSFIGAFVFDEIKAGSPYIYIGMFALGFFVFYFLNQRIRWQEKLVAFSILLVYCFSFHYEFLDKIWHGGQFPIWYPFRFSFTLSFFMLSLACKAYKERPKVEPLWQILCLIFGFFGMATYYFLHLADYPFLDEAKVFLSLMFFFAYIVIQQYHGLNKKFRSSLIFSLLIIELVTNAHLIMQNFDYVEVSKFRDYTHISSLALENIAQKTGKHDFYRIHKTFMRTKNEAMYLHYNGLDHFGSTIEANVPQLYGYLGLPNSSGAVAYTNGTLVTDAFFGVEYIIDVTDDTEQYTKDSQYVLYQRAKDVDNAYYPIYSKADRYKIYENQKHLGLGVEVSDDVLSAEFYMNDPIRNQETLLSLMEMTPTSTSYFKTVPILDVTYHDVNVLDKGDGDYYHFEKASSNSDGYYQISFEATSPNPYYFSMPSQFSSSNVSMALNESRYRFYSPYRKRQIMNATYGEIGPQELKVFLLEDNLRANFIYVYEFDVEAFSELINQKQAHKLQVEEWNHQSVKGSITTEHNSSHLLLSIPYDEAWQVKVDGKHVAAQAVLNDTLMAVPLSKGTHQIELAYRPRSILYGFLTSLVGLILLMGDLYINNRKQQKNIENHELIGYTRRTTKKGDSNETRI